jgi:hypothetical protein
VRNDPFAVFAAAAQNNFFIGDEKQLVAYLQQAAPREQLKVPIREKQTGAFFADWPRSEVRKLYEQSLQAPNLLKQNQSLLFFDSNLDEIYTLLSSLLLLLLPHNRAACTFDTFVEGCLPTTGTFWAVGTTRQINRANFLPVQLARHSINVKEEPENASEPGAIIYSSWLLTLLQNCADLQEINEEVFSVQRIAEAFLSKKALSDHSLDERVLQQVYQVNAQFINQLLLQVVAEAFLEHSRYTGESVRVKRLIKEFIVALHAFLPLKKVMSIAAEGAYHKINLAWIIYQWQFNEPVINDDWHELHKFASHAGYAPLLLMTCLKTHAQKSFVGSEEKARVKVVQHLLKEKRLVGIVNELLNPHQRPPELQVRPQNTSTGTKKGFELTEDEFLLLVSTLIMSGAGNILTDAFIERVYLMRNKKALRELAKTAKKAPGVPPAFVRTLERQSQ